MNEKIKKLIKLVGQLNKLLLKVLELLGTVTLVLLSIKSIIELWGDNLLTGNYGYYNTNQEGVQDMKKIL